MSPSDPEGLPNPSSFPPPPDRAREQGGRQRVTSVNADKLANEHSNPNPAEDKEKSQPVILKNWL
jgi:hypothetical protein